MTAYSLILLLRLVFLQIMGLLVTFFILIKYIADQLFSGVFFFSWDNDPVDLETFQVPTGYNLTTMYAFLDPLTYFNKFIYVSKNFNSSTGLYFTASISGVSFDRTGGTGVGCDKLSKLFSTVCLQCTTPNILYKNKCYVSCPTSATAISYGINSYCISCHHSCTSCTTSKKYSRLLCDTCNSGSGFSLLSPLGCICSITYNEYNKQCSAAINLVTKCPAKYNVYDYDYLCKYQCPPETFQYFDYANQTFAALSSSTSGYDPAADCVRDMNQMHFSLGSPGLPLPASTADHSTLAQTEFTMSFWLFLDSVISTSAGTYTTFVAAFNQISISQKNTAPSYLTMTLYMTSPTELDSLPSPAPYCASPPGPTCLAGKFEY